MLQDKDRIFTNIYGWNGPDLKSAKSRGDWQGTKELIKLGHDKIINNNNEDIIVVQIAGLIARRIVCEVDKDKQLTQGERLGMIRFGSRADIYFENYKPLVKVGQKTIAGETLLAKR